MPPHTLHIRILKSSLHSLWNIVSNLTISFKCLSGIRTSKLWHKHLQIISCHRKNTIIKQKYRNNHRLQLQSLPTVEPLSSTVIFAHILYSWLYYKFINAIFPHVYWSTILFNNLLIIGFYHRYKHYHFVCLTDDDIDKNTLRRLQIRANNNMCNYVYLANKVNIYDRKTAC